MRYGKEAQMISGCINMFAGLAVGFSMLSSFSVLLGEYAGMGEGTARVIGAVFFALTATMGGLRGVAITDGLQAILILSGTAVMTVVSVLRVGGMDGFAAQF